MKISPKGNVMYESLEEIINDGICELEESDNYYYVTSQKDPYIQAVRDIQGTGQVLCGSETFWKVDKKTEKVVDTMNYVRYAFGDEEKATPINVDKFLSERKRHSA